MLDALYDLFQRETDAVTSLEARLRVLELLAAADERRFLASAVDELEAASEELAGLELTRVLALAAAGWSPELTAGDLLARIEEPEARVMLAGAVGRLTEATHRMEDARERARLVVARGAGHVRSRLAAAEALATA